MHADAIIIGPGDLYASLMPNLVVQGIQSTFKQTKAKIIYIANLMTSYSQTHELTATDHVKVIEKAIRTKLNYIILNNAPLNASVLSPYTSQNEYPVRDDLPTQDTRVIRAPLIRTAITKPVEGDQLTRSFLRHDSHKLAGVIHGII